MSLAAGASSDLVDVASVSDADLESGGCRTGPVKDACTAVDAEQGPSKAPAVDAEQGPSKAPAVDAEQGASKPEGGLGFWKTRPLEAESSHATVNSEGNHVEPASVDQVDLESNNGTSTTEETERSQATETIIENVAKRERTAFSDRRNAFWSCLSLALTVAAAFVAFMMLFCLRDPVWEVVETHVDPEALAAMSLAAVRSCGDRYGHALSPGHDCTAELTMTSTIRIFNPNIIDAVVEPENVRVTAFLAPDRKDLFATSRLDGFTFKRRSTTTLISNVTVRISPRLAPLITNDVLGNHGTMKLEAMSEAVVHAGIFRLRAGMKCQILANMKPFVTGENPQNSIQEKECTYYKRWGSVSAQYFPGLSWR
jgi:hypothetical protein